MCPLKHLFMSTFVAFDSTPFYLAQVDHCNLLHLHSCIGLNWPTMCCAQLHRAEKTLILTAPNCTKNWSCTALILICSTFELQVLLYCIWNALHLFYITSELHYIYSLQLKQTRFELNSSWMGESKQRRLWWFVCTLDQPTPAAQWQSIIISI